MRYDTPMRSAETGLAETIEVPRQLYKSIESLFSARFRSALASAFLCMCARGINDAHLFDHLTEPHFPTLDE